MLGNLSTQAGRVWLSVCLLAFFVHSVLLAVDAPPPATQSLAAQSPANQAEQSIVSVQIIPEKQAIVPGKPLWTIVSFSIAPNWHLYGKHPGQVGLPPKIVWSLPPGFQEGEVLWPQPERIEVAGTEIEGYSHSLVLLASLISPPDLAEGASVTIKADVSWLACSTSCVPGSTTVQCTLPVANATENDPKVEGEFQKARHAVEQTSPHLHGIRSAEEIDAFESQAWYKQLGAWVQHVLTPDASHVLLLAFLGGILLNIMPCVLPVVSLKVLHFLELRGQSRAASAKHGLAFFFGVLLSFWALALGIFLLQRLGKTVGWGFQLQEPIFVAILIIILFLFSLSLFGVFSFGISLASRAGSLEQSVLRGEEQHHVGSKLSASFFSGVLATFVAAPCTGPFVGSAIGLAATLDPLYAFAIFSALGIGMAIPYLLLSLFPSLAAFLPRPGRWMETFKELMGFFMLATVLWLIWVLELETPALPLQVLVLSCFFLAFGAWVYGRWGSFERTKPVRFFGKLVAYVVIIATSAFLLSGVRQAKLEAITQHEISPGGPLRGEKWEEFSPEQLQELRAQHIPVFVDVTARWCLTCQANRLVLEMPAVRQAFIHQGVVKMNADWTNGSVEITDYIRTLGRNGVPVYALYGATDSEKPLLLSELLTQETVIDALDQIKKAQVEPEKGP